MTNVTLNFLRGLIGVTLLSINGHTALANHGPGTSGGGSSTASGETLKANTWDLSFRLDYTGFEHISQAEAEQRAIESGGFDAISRSVIASTSLSYGITDEFQISASWGYYWGDNFIDAEADGMGGAEAGTADVNGLTDLWLNAKWRVMKGAPGNLSLIGGVKFPVGKDDVHLSNGELLEPSSQPGFRCLRLSSRRGLLAIPQLEPDDRCQRGLCLPRRARRIPGRRPPRPRAGLGLSAY